MSDLNESGGGIQLNRQNYFKLSVKSKDQLDKLQISINQFPMYVMNFIISLQIEFGRRNTITPFVVAL